MILQFFLCGCFHSALHSRLSKRGKMCGCQQMHMCWWVAGGSVPDRWEHTGSTCICPLLHHWKQDFRAHLRHLCVDLQKTKAAVALLPVPVTTRIKNEPIWFSSNSVLHLFPTEPVQCQKLCRNGGVCMGFNRCRCVKGFTGEVCETGQCAACARAGFTPLPLAFEVYLFSTCSCDHPLCAPLSTWSYLQSTQYLYLSRGHCGPALWKTVSLCLGRVVILNKRGE